MDAEVLKYYEPEYDINLPPQQLLMFMPGLQ